MKHVAITFLLLAGLSAFAGRKPIHTGQVELSEGHTLEQVSKAIKKSLAGRGWTLLESKDNEITARLNLRSHMAKVRFEFDTKNVTIHYVDSKNLDFKEKKGVKKIHRNYNKWIYNLERDISNHLI